MKILDVLEGIEYRLEGENVEISGLFHNSRDVKEGGLFFAINGTTLDGYEFIGETLKRGAVAVVCDREVEIEGLTKVYVKDVRLAMSLCASNFYENPSKDLLVIGVTGTNGKTTTTFMLESIFKKAGKKVGIIGTNGSFIDGTFLSTSLTTPDPIILQKTLAFFRDNGVDVVCMEVSAHALYLQKIRGVMTDIALFTNLTQDHLDFFKSMEEYASVKSSFFLDGYAKNAVINADDNLGKELISKVSIPFLSYSQESTSLGFADIIASNVTHNKDCQSFKVSTPVGGGQFLIKLMGKFNVSNALCAIGAGLLAGIGLDTIAKGLAELEGVEGRFNFYEGDGVRVIIDYAHTPDGLKNLLSAARELTQGKVILVFGCGGNRDTEKRPIMGHIAEKMADFVFITNDNPRFEEPKEIAKQIIGGIEGDNYVVVLDREKAIKRAIKKSKRGDVVVLAGKGAEDYIDVMGHRLPYSDKSVVERILKIKRG